jgi:integrase
MATKKKRHHLSKLQRDHHPKKGSRIKVDPIRKVSDVQKIAKQLRDKPRDLLFFLMGVNNGLRSGDLLKLKVWQVMNCEAGDTVTIKESKTKKENVLVINKRVHKALTDYLSSAKLDPEDYLFKSRKSGKQLTIQAVNAMIKRWAAAAKLRGNFGAHTLRKTWGYIQRKKFGVGYEIICKRFNHSSPSVTMRYLGITDREVNHILQNNEIG